METGALDERFSLWSAKPAKAVRLRHAPLKQVFDKTLLIASMKIDAIFVYSTVIPSSHHTQQCLRERQEHPSTNRQSVF